jgi:hypothetical protein
VKKDREESQQEGSVKITSYIAYFTAGYGLLAPLIVLLFFLIAQGCIVASDYWLSQWATKEQDFYDDHYKCAANATLSGCEYFENYYNQSSYSASAYVKFKERDQEFLIYSSNETISGILKRKMKTIKVLFVSVVFGSGCDFIATLAPLLRHVY